MGSIDTIKRGFKRNEIFAIEFIWNAQDFDAQWTQECEKFKQYFEANNGVYQLPLSKTPLGGWISNQRQDYKAGKLRPIRKELLDAIGFKW